MTGNKNNPDRLGSYTTGLPETESVFFREGFLATDGTLGQTPSEREISDLCNLLYPAIDSLTGSLIRRCLKEGLKVDCRKGCPVCCHQTVLVLPHEMFFLEQFVRRECNSSQRKDFIKKAGEKDDLTSAMTAMQFIRYKHPCPMLGGDGSCLVYAARPMACRIYLSSSVESCMAEYHDPGNPEVYPALYEFLLTAGRMINEGVSAALAERNILNTQWQFESSFLTACEPGSFSRWAMGEDLFRKRLLTEGEEAYLDSFSKKA